ncbi:MAG: hypothetical protein QOF44_595 [Streptomyces sp.]|jgi:hypothetical protein|nr:hypothetical protein [Streptomyces sp.]
MSRVTRFSALLAMAAATVLGGAATASADDGARAVAIGSPGILSGNVIQVPIHIPINACGNTVNVVGLLNPAIGNTCINGFGDHRDRDHGNRGDDHRFRDHDHDHDHGNRGDDHGSWNHDHDHGNRGDDHGSWNHDHDHGNWGDDHRSWNHDHDRDNCDHHDHHDWN